MLLPRIEPPTLRLRVRRNKAESGARADLAAVASSAIALVFVNQFGRCVKVKIDNFSRTWRDAATVTVKSP